MKLRWLASCFPLAGLGSAAALVWALSTRLQEWSARSFVLLFYAGLLCAVVSQITAQLLRRQRQDPLPDVIGQLRGILTLLAVVGALWVWTPTLLEPIVGWCLRQVSVWRFN
jgi:hypothetical protein